MKNVRRRKEFRKYAFVILRTTKSAEIRFMTNQIAIIYNDLNVKFQTNLTKANNITTLNVFLCEIDDFKHI